MQWPDVLNSYLAAYEFRPSRAEPLFRIAKHYREAQQFDLAYDYASAGSAIPYPEDILFIERNVYEYELPLEYGICCYWLGKHEEAIRINDQIIACPNVPPNFLETARKNREYSIEKLAVGDLKI
jgi:tetratricopeptide (TPR) repeat protein